MEVLQSFPPISMPELIAVEALIAEDAIGDILMLPALEKDEEVDISIMLVGFRSGKPPAASKQMIVPHAGLNTSLYKSHT
jgi:hypothetical protein